MQKISQAVRFGCGLLLGASVGAGAGDETTTAAWQRLHARSAETLAALAHTSATEPVADKSAVEISFRELLAPSGDGGLQYSDRLRALAGKRVRLTGYMVREPRRLAGRFILAPRPVTVDGSCFADDIPPHAVYVHLLGSRAASLVPYQPGRMVLIGVIELGSQAESDGRRSAIRLLVEELPAGPTSLSVEAPAP